VKFSVLPPLAVDFYSFGEKSEKLSLKTFLIKYAGIFGENSPFPHLAVDFYSFGEKNEKLSLKTFRIKYAGVFGKNSSHQNISIIHFAKL
jgi:hypothetical protein